MREIRQSGSEGGGGESNRLSLPLLLEDRVLTQSRKAGVFAQSRIWQASMRLFEHAAGSPPHFA